MPPAVLEGMATIEVQGLNPRTTIEGGTCRYEPCLRVRNIALLALVEIGLESDRQCIVARAE